MPHPSRPRRSADAQGHPPASAAAPNGGERHAQDFVTSLEPRGLLEERLAAILPPRQPLAMVIVDVVGLKAVNELEGFLAGDAMLRAAADRLRLAAGRAALLARLGGDELVALFLGQGAGETALRAADELAAATQPPPLRAAALTAASGETAAKLIERLYATLRRS